MIINILIVFKTYFKYLYIINTPNDISSINRYTQILLFKGLTGPKTTDISYFIEFRILVNQFKKLLFV